jgi:hypothetical protein
MPVHDSSQSCGLLRVREVARWEVKSFGLQRSRADDDDNVGRQRADQMRCGRLTCPVD